MAPSIGKFVSKLGRAALLVVPLVFAITACSGEGSRDAPAPEATLEQESATPAVSVVATTNIVSDWVRNIGGDNVEVFSLVPVGSDPHTFQPGARDVARVADADLVLSIGLGLEEGWLRDLLQNAARDPSTIVELGEIVDPLEFAAYHADEVALLEEISHVIHEVEEGEISPEVGLEEIEALVEMTEENEGEHHEEEGDEEGEEHHEEEGDEAEEGEHHEEEELPQMVIGIVDQVRDGRMEADVAIEAIEGMVGEGEEEHEDHGHGLEDPHFWFDPLRVKLAVNDIAARLSELDPAHSDVYTTNASAYNGKLDELHGWTEEQVNLVPDDRKVLVTSHDSLGYFASLYGFDVVAVILSITTDVEPSPEDLAHVVEEIMESRAPAVFGETTVSERLASAVAAESGARLVRLYSGSLGTEGSGADTYIDMVRTNVARIVEALR